MIRISKMLIASGFFWMLLWAVVGGLMGATLHASTLAADTSWLESWERMLIRTAHAHMNSMGMSLILMGLVAPRAARPVGDKLLLLASRLALVSVPVFGFGLLVEAFHPPGSAFFPLVVAVVALAGTGYIVALGSFFTIFFTQVLHSTRGGSK